MKDIENTVACCRCGELIEPEFEMAKPETLIELTLNEQSFIHLKFKGPLCLPCLNQLKTSYKIVSGHYNPAPDQNVSL